MRKTITVPEIPIDAIPGFKIRDTIEIGDIQSYFQKHKFGNNHTVAEFLKKDLQQVKKALYNHANGQNAILSYQIKAVTNLKTRRGTPMRVYYLK